MLKRHETHTGRRGSIIKFCSHEFYTAIMEEDVKSIEGLSKKYGSNSLIEIQGNASGDIFWKGFTILPLHLAASYRRVQSTQSLLLGGADTEKRSGQTSILQCFMRFFVCSRSWSKKTRLGMLTNSNFRCFCKDHIYIEVDLR